MAIVSLYFRLADHSLNTRRGVAAPMRMWLRWTQGRYQQLFCNAWTAYLCVAGPENLVTQVRRTLPCSLTPGAFLLRFYERSIARVTCVLTVRADFGARVSRSFWALACLKCNAPSADARAQAGGSWLFTAP